MFTGIIEEVGTVSSLQRNGPSIRLTVSAAKILQDIRAGDSISVNGICLTVTNFTGTGFTADVMHETVAKTALSGLRMGSKVNLERAMPVNGRFGGHIVTGHIDGTGTITGIEKDSIAVWYTVQTSPDIMRLITKKGSIAMDGISLTVAGLSKDEFRVSVIPHTAAHTALAAKKVGEPVNLENDCIGKYVEKLLFGENNPSPNVSSKISREFLTKYGF